MSVNTCPRCSIPRASSTRLCPNCGFDFWADAAVTSCPRCHAARMPGAPGCMQCGWSFVQAAGPSSVPSPGPAAPYQGQYMAPFPGQYPGMQGTPAAAMRKRGMLLPLLLVGLVIVVAGAVIGTFALSQSGKSNVANNGSPSPAATASATATVSPTPTTAVPSGPADTGWITFSPKGAGFTAKFPGEPKLQSSTVKTQAGNVPASIWMYLASANSAYAIMKVTYPSSVTKGVSPSVLFDGGMKGLTSNGDVTIVSQSDTKMNGHPGRIFEATSPTYDMKGAVYLAGSTMYMVYAMYEPGSDPPGVDTFLADFKLTA